MAYLVPFPKQTAFQSEITNFPPPHVFNAPTEPLQLGIGAWNQKTRMVAPPG